MRPTRLRTILVFSCLAGAGVAQTATTGPGGLLQGLKVATIAGSGGDSIQAMTTDAAGNIYVAGSTTSLDLPVKNTAQLELGGTNVNYSLDGGRTWNRAGSPTQSPAHRAYYVTDAKAEGKKDDRIELGAAWEHRDNKGFDVVLKAMRIGDFNGRITLGKIEPKKEPAA